jgi:hypothetical protein
VYFVQFIAYRDKKVVGLCAFFVRRFMSCYKTAAPVDLLMRAGSSPDGEMGVNDEFPYKHPRSSISARNHLPQATFADTWPTPVLNGVLPAHSCNHVANHHHWNWKRGLFGHVLL